jgi:hypothetical protein
MRGDATGRRGLPGLEREPRYDLRVLEVVYTSLLVLVFLLGAWFAGYVVYRLYQGQR